MAAAREMGVAVRAVQQVNDEDEVCDEARVTLATDNAEVLDRPASGSANLVGGTAWLWSREDMAGAVDVLVVDEAGQISLANALAVSPGCRQPGAARRSPAAEPAHQGRPPAGRGRSGARARAGRHATITARDRGLFIPETRRLHPDVCAFTSETFYEGQLRPLAGLERQIVTSAGRLRRHRPALHPRRPPRQPERLPRGSGGDRQPVRRAARPERSTWTDQHGKSASVTPDDVLVVAPYNAQVAASRSGCPAPGWARWTSSRGRRRRWSSAR